MFLRILLEELNNISIECKLNNKKIELSCKYLIGADGGQSRLRKMIDPYYQSTNSGCAYQVVYVR